MYSLTNIKCNHKSRKTFVFEAGAGMFMNFAFINVSVLETLKLC